MAYPNSFGCSSEGTNNIGLFAEMVNTRIIFISDWRFYPDPEKASHFLLLFTLENPELKTQTTKRRNQLQILGTPNTVLLLDIGIRIT